MAIIKPTLNLVASEYTPEILNVTRASGATRVNAAGLVERVSDGTLRYDHDPTTLAGKGWLFEAAKTNLILQSELTSTSYTNSQSTDSDNDTTAPDGTTTAGTIIDNGVASSHGIYQAPTFVSGTSYTLSAFFKPKELTHAVLRFATTAFPAEMFVEFDLVNLTSVDVSASGAVDAITMEQYPDGWVRCSITDTADASSASVVSFNTSDGNGTSPSYIGSTEGVYVWGCQLEAGSFPTSYIPTTTAAVTRAVDKATVALSDFDFSETAYTMYAHVISPQDDASAQAYYFCNVYQDSNDYHMFGFNAGNLINYLRAGTVMVDQNLVTGFAANTEYRVSASVATNDWAGVVDGGTVLTDTSVTMSPAAITFNLGDYQGANPSNIHIKHMAIFNTNMSDADIQTITTG